MRCEGVCVCVRCEGVCVCGEGTIIKTHSQ